MKTVPEHLKSIQNQFNRVIEYSQGFSPDTNQLFLDWLENKREFIEWFGGKYIQEISDVEFHIDKNKKDYIVNDFIDQCGHIMGFREFSNFYQFVQANRDTFFNNMVNNEVLTFGKPVKKGMKLSKAFKYFISDKDLLNQIQQLASTYIQKDKIHGKLCLSIHPLDYLSASETTYKWRSCHALNGEYRAGNLSYMADNATICCYIRGEDEVQLPDFPQDVPWNSKKWRMWIHLDDEWQHCFLGRQYPFELDNITQHIQCILPGVWDRFTDTYFEGINDEKGGLSVTFRDDYYALNTARGYELCARRDVIKERSFQNYNDLLHSSCYNPYYASKRYISTYKKPILNVGRNVNCLYCNEIIIPQGAGLMTCLPCAESLGLYHNQVECICCGNIVSEDEIIYLFNGDTICTDCAEGSEVACCENCGEWFYTDEMEYSECYGAYYCSNCFEHIFDEEMEYRRDLHERRAT